MKFFVTLLSAIFLASLPTRERGLKLFGDLMITHYVNVAPYAGAWIEISTTSGLLLTAPSLPTRERGLK